MKVQLKDPPGNATFYRPRCPMQFDAHVDWNEASDKGKARKGWIEYYDTDGKTSITKENADRCGVRVCHGSDCKIDGNYICARKNILTDNPFLPFAVYPYNPVNFCYGGYPAGMGNTPVNKNWIIDRYDIPVYWSMEAQNKEGDKKWATYPSGKKQIRSFTVNYFGTLTGNIFDASKTLDCTKAAQFPLSGVTVTAHPAPLGSGLVWPDSAGGIYNANPSDVSGSYSVTLPYDNYSDLAFSLDDGTTLTPAKTCDSSSAFFYGDANDQKTAYATLSRSFGFYPPSGFSIDSFNILSDSGTVVIKEPGTSRNQICDSRFNGSRRVRFDVALDKPDVLGAGIREADLILNNGGTEDLRVKADNLDTVTTESITGGGGASFWGPGITTSVSGNVRNVSFYVNFPLDFQTGNFRLYNLLVYGKDINGVETPGGITGMDTNRDFKIWDCQVSLSGSMYDSAGVQPVCSSGVGFVNLAGPGMNFNSVSILNNDDGSSQTVNANQPGGNTYSASPVTWGKNYSVTPNADLAASGVINQWLDLGAGTTSCGTGMAISQTVVDAYNANPTLEVNLSGAAAQGPWFQAVGGGVAAAGVGAELGEIDSMVPPSCVSPCQPAISINSVTNDNGLVSAPLVTSKSGCDLEGGACFYGITKDWGYQHNTVRNYYGYSYFYNNYYSKTGAGVVINTGTSMSQLFSSGVGPTGVILVDGDVTIDTNNTVGVGQFLMIVSSGQININQDVTQTEGVLVANEGISASGSNDTQLQINGIVYAASGDVSLSRGYVTQATNAVSPGVLVTYRPDLLFNMPSALSKVLTNWSQGK